MQHVSSLEESQRLLWPSRAPANKDPDAGKKRPVGLATSSLRMQSFRLPNSEETMSLSLLEKYKRV